MIEDKRKGCIFMKENKSLKITLIIALGLFLITVGLIVWTIVKNIGGTESEILTVNFIGENNEILKVETVEKGSLLEQWDPENTIGFEGWFLENGEIFDFNSSIEKDTTLYARWGEYEETETNLVLFLVDDEAYQSLEVPVGVTIDEEPEAPVKEGYTFVGWYENDTLFDFNTPITSPHTLVARFQ